MRADDAVERRGDVGVAVIDLRDLGVDLGLLQIGLHVVARRGRGIERGLRDGLLLHQFHLPLVIGLGLFQRGLRAGLGGLRLFELELVGLGLDGEQRGAFLYEGTVLVIDRLQKTLHARDQVDVLDRRGIAGGVEIARDRFLNGHRDLDLRRRRRYESILFAGGEQKQRQRRERKRRARLQAIQPDKIQRTHRLHLPCPEFISK